MSKILILENFLDQEKLKQYQEFAKSTNLWERAHEPQWDQRSLNLSSMPNDIRESMLDYRVAVKEQIQKHFNLNKNLFADIFQFVRWLPGDSLDPAHADSENIDHSPHPYPYRNFAAITYLNTDFEGGRITFPQHDNLTPEIKPGMLVAFPGTLEYLHSVSKITSGVRYTIAGFFTYDERYKDAYRI